MSASRIAPASVLRNALGLVLLLAPIASRASFLSPEMEDTVANYLSWFILIALPPGGIALFWMVHILPEKAAEKRHHPQRDGITMLCLLSLLFGGLLWPLAWLWAYTRPIGFKAAYGTDKHEDYYVEHAEKLHAALATDAQVQQDIRQLKEELEAMARKHPLSSELEAVRSKLAASLETPTDTVQGGTA